MKTVDLHNQEVDFLCPHCESGQIWSKDKLGFDYSDECASCFKGHADGVGLGDTIAIGDKLVESEYGIFEVKEGHTSKDGNFNVWIAYNDLGEAFIIPALTSQGLKNNL